MTTGRVKWFDPKKGFGFLIGPEGQDVFIHFTQIKSDGFRSLKDGELVNYVLEEGEKGWHARDCERAEGDGEAGGGEEAAPESEE